MSTETLMGLLQRELQDFRRARAAGDVKGAWTALERAHILSQPTLVPHMRVHWHMLAFAIRTGEYGEVIGQLTRLALAPLGSLTGRIPWGNTGRANVSAFEPMPVPADLRDSLRRIK